MPNSVQTWTHWWRNAQTVWDIALSAPQVIAHRTARMALAGHSPSARDQQEFQRMGAEKLEAMGESAVAVMFQMWQAQQAATLVLMGAWWKPQAWFDTGPWLRAMPGVTAAGLKPVHRRVTANAKRLSGIAVSPALPALVAAAAPAKRAKRRGR
ncbi:polyhydroxyalkanoate granule-associated phasin [Azohydromonas caseinilytica]|uniref:polyhydroxyalkanoate granule-associated phasin n=1 Tax=Azohydromonas caseinilytica TaxID=2728836 RepID=UPI00197B95E8|nr:polyhydroxyalkanoate granule-associated phasin [Azohydromonas caseinilytica]